jgi:DNA-binding XRE family transcriptional regulator
MVLTQALFLVDTIAAGDRFAIRSGVCSNAVRAENAMRASGIDHQKIIAIRKEHQLTQAQLSKLAGVHLDTVHSLEAGRPPRMSTILRICRVLSVDPSQLERR